MCGTTCATVSRIKNGQVWANVTGHKKSEERLPVHITTKLSEENVLDIYKSDAPQSEIAKKYNIKQSTVSDIKTGRSWSKVTGHKRNKDKN